MAGKAGGRLTFSGRQEYVIRSMTSDRGDTGYIAMCDCALGNHYLALDAEGYVIEGTLTAHGDPEHNPFYLFAAYVDAECAIEQWQRQHAEAQANSGESEG